MENKRIDPLLLWGHFYSYIVTGMSVLVMGAIMPYLIEDFGIQYKDGGLLIALQAIGNLGASFIGGIVSDRIGRKPVMVFGALCFFIGFGGIFFISSSSLLFVLIFISGIGWGIMSILVNAVMNDVSGGRGDIMNLLHMFFAIGAFLIPLLVGLLVRLDITWRYSVLILSLLSAILFVLLLIMPIPDNKRTKTEDKSSISPFRDVRYYIFMLLIFLYVGAENSINGWMVTYLDDLNTFKSIRPQDVLSLFWIAIILGRLLSAMASKFVSKEALILTSALGGGIFFILFVLSHSPRLMVLWVLFMGLFYAGIYPTIVANAGPIIHGSGTATGVLLSLGGLGGAVFPYINGIIADSKGLYAGMTAIAVTAIILIGFSLINYRLGRREGMDS